MKPSTRWIGAITLTLIVYACASSYADSLTNIWQRSDPFAINLIAFSKGGGLLIQYDPGRIQLYKFNAESGILSTNTTFLFEDTKANLSTVYDPLISSKQSAEETVLAARARSSDGDYSILLSYQSSSGWTNMARFESLDIHHLDTSSDGRWIALGGTISDPRLRPDVGRVILLDRLTGVVQTNLAVEEQPVQVAFSPDTTRVVVGNFCNYGDNPARIRIYSVPDLNEIAVGVGFPLLGVVHLTDFTEDDFYTANVCTALTVSSRGQIISTESQLYWIDWWNRDVTNHVYVHDLRDGHLIRKFPAAEASVIRCLAVSPDGRVAATGTGRFGWDIFTFQGASCGNTTGNFEGGAGMVRFWRISDGQLLWVAQLPQTGPGQPPTPTNYAPRNILFSPDGRHFAYSLDGGFIGYSQLPLLVTGFELAKGTAELSWLGGGGRYRIEKSSGLGQPWTLATVTTNFSFSTTLGDREAYFRVQDATVE